MIAHRPRYEATLTAYRRAQSGDEPDTHWRAMLLVVTAHPGTWEKVRPYLDFTRGDAWLQRCRDEQDLTSGDRQLLDIAQNLFDGSTKVDIGAAARTLDSPTWEAVIEALRIAREA